jgi:hypothetical protein
MRVFQTVLKISFFIVSVSNSFCSFAYTFSGSNTPEEMESYLAKFTGEQAVLARAKLIKELANLIPNDKQRDWVIEQQKHQGSIIRINPDHPNQKMTVASVGMSAKATLLHWNIARLAEVYTAQVQDNSWQWAAYLKDQHINKSSALTVMLKGISDEKVYLLQQELLSNYSAPSSLASLINNKDLLALIKRFPSEILSEQLLTNSVNEFSYQHIQLIPKLYQDENAIHLLKQANIQEKLTSQALMTMAKKYSEQQEVQAFLLHQLTQPKVAWFAAAAITQSTSEQLHRKVMQMKKTNAAVDYAQQRKLVMSEDKEKF